MVAGLWKEHLNSHGQQWHQYQQSLRTPVAYIRSGINSLFVNNKLFVLIIYYHYFPVNENINFPFLFSYTFVCHFFIIIK